MRKRDRLPPDAQGLGFLTSPWAFFVSTMTEYVDQATVKKRATKHGWKYIADRDHDGAVNTDESGEVEYAISWASTLLDELVYPRIGTGDARGQANAWLRDRALDLAVYRLFTNGGDDAPESIQRAYDDALDAMKRVRGGISIPGLTMIHPRPSSISAKVPRGYMPK